MKRPLLTTLLFLCASCGGSPYLPPDPAPPRAEPPQRAAAPTPPTEVVRIEWCGDTADGFDDWIASFRRYSITQGIAPDLVARALGHVGYDPDVVELDRAQKRQNRTLEEFARSHVTPARVKRGKRLLDAHANLLSKITARYNVAEELVVAIWGLETDFGVNRGKTQSLHALATLAYDCRRAPLFRGELSSALRILQRGDLSVEEMVGAWAGELGQTQFLPSSYERFGIDFDGDGRIDLVNSTEDALASTARYLSEHGWCAGEGYQPGSPNFAVLAEWNKSEIYRKTIALFASKLAKTR